MFPRMDLQVVETPNPRWLDVLLAAKFFQPCLLHEIVRKNDKNVLCLDCCTALCSHCLLSHNSHRLLQIRRYVYHDVIRLEDGEKLIDCSSVQSYTNNGARVVFINERPQVRAFKASGNFCVTCNRSLQKPFLCCSLSCKVKYLVKTEGGVSNHLVECNFLPLPGLTEQEDDQMTPISILEPTSSSGSSYGGDADRGIVLGGCYGSLGLATNEFVRKKRSNLTSGRTGSGRFSSPFAGMGSPLSAPISPVVDSLPSASRSRSWRKSSTPHRSPMY